jgi:hypothetical protein
LSIGVVPPQMFNQKTKFKNMYKRLIEKLKALRQYFVICRCSEKEEKAFRAGFMEGRFFMKNYGSLLGDDVKAIKEQIDEDWHNYNGI